MLFVDLLEFLANKRAEKTDLEVLPPLLKKVLAVTESLDLAAKVSVLHICLRFAP